MGLEEVIEQVKTFLSWAFPILCLVVAVYSLYENFGVAKRNLELADFGILIEIFISAFLIGMGLTILACNNNYKKTDARLFTLQQLLVAFAICLVVLGYFAYLGPTGIITSQFQAFKDQTVCIPTNMTAFIYPYGQNPMGRTGWGYFILSNNHTTFIGLDNFTNRTLELPNWSVGVKMGLIKNTS